MRNYIQEIDEEFIKRVVGGFLIKEWYAKYVAVNLNSECQVVYKINDSYYKLKLSNFNVDFVSKCFGCTSLVNRWRANMYIKFGEEYLRDLEKIASQEEIEKIKEIKRVNDIKKHFAKDKQK